MYKEHGFSLPELKSTLPAMYKILLFTSSVLSKLKSHTCRIYLHFFIF